MTRSGNGPSPTVDNPAVIKVGGWEFGCCVECGQPLDAVVAARAEFRLHDEMYEELHVLTQQAQALVGAIGRLRKQMEGGYQGMRDPFWADEEVSS